MKKVLLLLMSGVLISTVNAQTPMEKNKGMIGKMTATWCGPCGSWGWTLANDVISTNSTNSFYIAYFSSSSSSYDNNKFYNQESVTLSNRVGGGGYPTFSYNLTDHSSPNTSGGGVNTAGVKSDVNAAATAFSTAPVVASTGMTYKISGNTVTVVTKTKFWQAATGNYSVAVYLVEDGAMNQQNGQGAQTSHKNVMRANLSGATTWGKQIATGTIAANATYNETFTLDISTVTGSSTWDKTKLKPIAIIYKTGGATSPEYVNGNDWYEFPASVTNLNAVENVAVYPNPASTNATMSFDMQNVGNYNLNVIDNLGRVVYTSGDVMANVGRTFHNINTANMAEGLYTITIKTDNGVSTERLSVVK